MEKNKLFIQGRISDHEIQALNADFLNEPFTVNKYSTGAAIGGIQDFIDLIFEDFSPFSFARDYLFGKIVEAIVSQIKPVVISLFKKDKVVKNLVIRKAYQKADSTFVFVQFAAKLEKFGILIQEIEDKLSPDFLEGVEPNRNVTIRLDDDDQLQVLVVD